MTIGERTSHYDFELPRELIAQHPLAERDASRLMVVDRAEQSLSHRVFRDVVDLFDPRDVLVVNRTRVMRARLLGTRASGAPAEILLLKQYERRNAASVLVDIRLHTRQWSMDQAMAFYREAGFAPARIEAEIVRNSMLPGSRLMYWLGVEGIKAMRRRWTGPTAGFHDTLLSYGHVPLAWVREEMEREGLLAP